MASSPDQQARHRATRADIKLLLRGHGSMIVAGLPRPVRRPKRVTIRGSKGTLIMHLLPPGHAAAASSERLALSGNCQLIIDRIRMFRASHPSAQLSQKRLADLIGWPVGPKLVYLLDDLKERGYVTHNDKSGYDLPPEAIG